MSNYMHKSNHTYINNIPKKYDSNILSSNNINFILQSGNHKKEEEEEKQVINNNTEINSTDKIISFNYSQENPYYHYSHLYTIPNDVKYNLVHTTGNVENDIQIKAYGNEGIKIKSVIDNKDICLKCLKKKKNLNDFCFACKRNYENKKIKDMVQEMFKGQQVETFIKTINIRTFNSPNKTNKNKGSTINLSNIENNINDKNVKNIDDINKNHNIKIFKTNNIKSIEENINEENDDKADKDKIKINENNLNEKRRIKEIMNNFKVKIMLKMKI